MLPSLDDFLTGKIKTLGWGVLDWCTKWLVNPDIYSPGGKGAPWIFRLDQAHFILAFYSVDDKGEWVYRRAYRERAKGTGKSPMVAAIACAEFLGPVRFSHFDPDTGQPVGVENESSMIWLAACSLEGSSHTYQYIMGMLEGKAEEAYGLDVGATRILIPGQSYRRIKQVTASPRSLEGPRPTFCIQEETQNWVPAEGGPVLDETIGRQLTKTDSRRIAVTNAPRPGEGSVAELTHHYQKAIEDGEVDEPGLLFDTFAIHVDNIYDKEQVMPALKTMYEHAPWQNLKTIWRDINDPSFDEINSRRFFFNEIVEPKALWLSEETWDAAKHPKLQLNKRDKIALGFRVRKYCSAVVATRLKDGATFLLKLWEKPREAPRDWEVDYTEIDKFMRKTIDTHAVVYVMTSPNGFADGIGRWQADYEDEVVFEAIWLDRNKVKHADAVEVFECAVRDRRFKHTGDPELRRHVMNAFSTEAPQGTLIRMETLHSKKFIVAAEAALLSFQGMIEAIEDGLGDDPPDNYIFGIG